MSDIFKIIGPDDAYFKGLPVGFRTLYQQIQVEQWRIWEAAGSPKPANDKLMKQINSVAWEAWKTDLGVALEKHNQYLPADMFSALANHQHHAGMLGTADLLPML